MSIKQYQEVYSPLKNGINTENMLFLKTLINCMYMYMYKVEYNYSHICEHIRSRTLVEQFRLNLLSSCFNPVLPNLFSTTAHFLETTH